jgi:hypothetical protein
MKSLLETDGLQRESVQYKQILIILISQHIHEYYNCLSYSYQS